MHEHEFASATERAAVVASIDFETVCRWSNGTTVPAQWAGTLCPASKPATTIKCPRCAFCEDAAQSQGCSGHGTCRGDACVCNSGWTGSICDVRANDCASGMRDSTGKCCTSGVIGNGKCCNSNNAVLDARGECCASGKLDACGVCGGAGKVVDVVGTCCEVRVLPMIEARHGNVPEPQRMHAPVSCDLQRLLCGSAWASFAHDLSTCDVIANGIVLLITMLANCRVS